jgi:hypothetical protein
VCPNERPFFDNTYLDLAYLITLTQATFDVFVMLGDLVLQMQSRSQIRRSGTHKYNVHLDLFTFDHVVKDKGLGIKDKVPALFFVIRLTDYSVAIAGVLFDGFAVNDDDLSA